MASRRYTKDRSETLILRLTSEEKSSLADDAKDAGVSMSDLARARLFAATTSTPEVVAATTYLANSVTTLEAALAEAKSVLGQKG